MATWIVISLLIAAFAFLGFHSRSSLSCGSCGGFEEPADINRKR
jgi:hypothetical protein